MNRPDRITLIHSSLIIFALALVGRAAQVQLWQRAAWMAKAERQHFTDAKMTATRGNIFDVSGVPLAQTSEFVRVSVAPREVKDRRQLARDLRRLGVDAPMIARATDTTRAWSTIPKHFLPNTVAAIAKTRGVYAEAFAQRDYTPRYATRRILGRVDARGQPLDGIELALDSVLRGRNGRAMMLRDPRSARPESPSDTAVVPRAGEDVVLTISQDLQEIAERALNDAVERGGASGGDILIMDPYSGEIRALASIRRDPRSSGSPLVSEPFEPGSTLKPFVAAALLARNRARADEVMELGDGTWEIEGRTVHDEHKAPRFSLADVIRYSSNVGIAKFAQRLSHAEQYQSLRDFGFGTSTGISLPAEASGLLRPPEKWSKQSSVSLAIGYEISVTALQLATAYAALANGGELLEPTLVKEIRGADGVARYRHERRVVRRVIDARVAATVRQMLIGAVEGGTADEAGLGNFQVAGKTGTAKRTINGRYRDSSYTPSFVGLFPADRPQYVILVKIDHPTVGSIFGGHTAAPVSKVVLEAAIAARDAALDRRALAAAAPPPPKPPKSGSTEVVKAPDTVAPRAVLAGGRIDTSASEGMVPYVASLPLPRVASPVAPGPPHAIPEVRGLALRDAVRELHRAGFRVQLAGFGDPLSTSPVAGAMAAPGSTVRLVSAP